MRFLGNKQDLIDNGFIYVEEFNAYVRDCKYTRDGQLYEDIFCVKNELHDVCVDIPRYCTNDVYQEVAKDLIEKGLLVEGPIAREPSVRAKFRCDTVWAQEDGKMIHVSFSPVMDGSKENEMFGQATASGSITMGIDPTVTNAVLVQGAEYYVDFTQVEKVE